MSTTVLNKVRELHYSEPRVSIIYKFISWCEKQESRRLLWLGLTLALQGCVLTPLAVLLVGLSGVNTVYIFVAMGAMALTLIPNLAAQPTKITIPLFFLSVLVDIAVVAAAVLAGLSSTNVYTV